MKSRFCILLILCLCFSLACGKKETEAPADTKSPAEKAYSEAQAYEKNNPDDLTGAALKYREYSEAYPFSSWAEEARQKSDALLSQRADEAWEQLEAFRADNAAEPEMVLARYQKFVDTYKDTPYAAKAAAVIAEMEKPEVGGLISWFATNPGGNPLALTIQFEQTSLPQGVSLVWKIQEKEFTGAKVEHLFPATGTYAVTLTVSQGEQELKVLEEILVLDLAYCRTAFNKEVEGIEALIKKGKFDAARARAGELAAWGVPELTDTASLITAKIDKTIAVLTKYFNAIFGLYNAEKTTFDIVKAIDLTKASLKQVETDFEREVVTQEYEKLKKLKTVYDAVLLGFKARIGKEFRISGISGKITGVGKGNLVIETAARTQYSRPVHQLRGEELVPMAEQIVARDDPPAFGMLLEFLCQFEKAADYYKNSKHKEFPPDLLVGNLAFKQGLFKGFKQEVTVAAEKKQGDAMAAMDMRRKADNLYTDLENLLKLDLEAIPRSKAYMELLGFPDWKEYQRLRFNTGGGGANAAEKKAIRKRVAQLTKKHPEYPKVYSLSQRLNEVKDNNTIKHLREEITAYKAEWSKVIAAKKDYYDELGKEMKVKRAEFDAQLADFGNWTKEAVQHYISTLEKERKRIRTRETRRGYNRDTEGWQGTKYEQIEKALRGYLFIGRRWQFLYEKNIKSLYAMIFDRLTNTMKVYDEEKFKMIHMKIFIDVELEKARFEYNKHFQ